MVPVSGQPVIHRTLTYLWDLGVRHVVIGSRADDHRLKQFIETRWAKRLATEWVHPDTNNGPGYTLLRCLERIPRENPCLVVLGDTAFTFQGNDELQSGRNLVLTAEVAETDRWCIATVSDDGSVTRLVDKPATSQPPYLALIGAYLIQEPAKVAGALGARLAQANRRLEISDGLESLIASSSLTAAPAGSWIDAGNPDKLAEARRHLVAPRSFNRLSLDPFRGTIRKQSEHPEKFIAEVDYYRKLPESLRIFFPRLVSASTEANAAFIELEYYGYPTLSELWTFEDLGTPFWNRVVDKLGMLLDAFAEYPASLAGVAVEAFYREKTARRMTEIQSQPAVQELAFRPELVVNGIAMPGWPSILSSLPERIGRLREGVAGRVIHGDLCFPNVLFDATLGLFRLIDPRGSFLERGVEGDGRLDAAKVLHSVEGGYDLIINDLFTLTEQGAEFELRLDEPAQRLEALAATRRMIGARFDLDEVRLIEGTLFLSMAALHADRPGRQRAMMLVGALLYHGLFDDANLYRR